MDTAVKGELRLVELVLVDNYDVHITGFKAEIHSTCKNELLLM